MPRLSTSRCTITIFGSIIAGDVDLQHIGTDLQTADIFTKALRVDKLQQFSMALGLRPLDMPSLRGSGEEDPPPPRLDT